MLVVSRTGAPQIRVLNASTGAPVGTLNITGISGGTFAISQIGVGSDGAIYAANLTTNQTTSPLKVYRWANESATPTVAYSGDTTGGLSFRAGDSMDVRGSGSATQIIFGLNTGSTPVAGANRIALLTTANGTTFTGSSIQYADQWIGFARLGIAFDSGDQFYGTHSGLKRLALDGTTTRTFISGSGDDIGEFPWFVGPIGVAPALNLLLGLNWASSDDTMSEVRLYDISDRFAPPVQLDSAVLRSPVNNNGNAAGAVDFDPARYRVFVLDTNNAIVAYSIPEPATLVLFGAASIGAIVCRRRG